MEKRQDVDSRGESKGEGPEGGLISDSLSLDSYLGDCIINVISLKTPRDACVLATYSKAMESVANSDIVWEKFLPRDYKFLVPRWREFSSKKELYLALCDDPVLIDNGKKRLWLEKGSGKRCIMLPATDLFIEWINDLRYWRWVLIPEARFGKVAELIQVCWFEIRGRINTRFLSPATCYSAYIVFKKGDNCSGFTDTPAEAVIAEVGKEHSRRFVYFDEATDEWNIVQPAEREDGWMEVELGEFFTEEVLQSHEIEISALEGKALNWKTDLIIRGIEIRPSKLHYGNAESKSDSEVMKEIEVDVKRVLKATLLSGKDGGAINRNVVDVSKVLEYFPEEQTDNTIDKSITCGATSAGSSSDAKTNADLLDSCLRISPMATKDKIWPQHPKVFINFRGVEMRTPLVSHLHRALKLVGINAFIDSDQGWCQDPANLFKSIKESDIALAILSSGYTESQWCLDELVKIKERVEEGKLVVIPVFYKLNPSEVRGPTGRFGLKLLEHVRLTSDFDKLKNWMEALYFVSQKHGLVFDEKSDNEADLVNAIVKQVMNVITRISLDSLLSEQQQDASIDFFRSKDLEDLDGERDDIICTKTERIPKETEIVQPDAKSRIDDGLHPNKDGQLFDKRVDPVIDEKKQENVSQSSTMVTYDKPLSERTQVFINFRGADLRHGFIDDIAKALKSDGVKVYIDVDELPCEDHTELLYQRIEESRIALVIFSNRHTESRWFLNKLVKIKELSDERKLLVIPIFYKVNQLEVTQLKGDFGVNFWNMWRINRDIHVLRWKEALESCSSLKGIYLTEHSISESKLTTPIVNEVLETVSLQKGENPSLFLSAKKGASTDLPTGEGEKHETYLNKCQLFGMEQRMEQLERKLEFECQETRIIGVVGMPGIGKTALAMMLYEKWSCKFIRSVPLLSIRKKSEEYELKWLQKKLWEVLLEGTFPDITDGTTLEAVKDELLQKKIFVVLDDVSNKEQLDFLLGNLEWIKKGSKIVITTCDKSLLEGFSHDTYVVPQLNYKESFQHFTYHAFDYHVCGPTKTFVELYRKFLEYTRGHPLALKRLGRELCGKNNAQWEEKLGVMMGSSNMLTQYVQRFFIDQLNDRQKDVFRDILYFFNSEDEYFVKSLLDSGDPDSNDAVSEVRDLANKFLITISDGRVEMNHLLYMFGKDLRSHERYRLWNYENIVNMLIGMDKQEANSVRGISLDMSGLAQSILLQRMAFTDMRDLRYLKIYGSCCPRQCKATCNFSLPDGLLFPLEEVRYLHWVKFPLQELPADFRPLNLVDLKLPYSKIERVWEGVKDTPRLKWVDLSHSSKLLDLSALSQAENLQRLNLEGCTSLDELPVEIQNMKSLVFLNMRGCRSLCHLPEMNLISLKTLILSDCSSLKEFKLISGSIEFLHLDGTAIKEVPPTIQNLQKLVMLNLRNCKMLECLPNCLGNMKVLDELILSGCSRLKDLPYGRNSLKYLKSLHLEETRVKEMPSISCFTGSEGPTSADMFLQSIGSHSTVRKWPCSVNGVSSLQRLCLSGNDFISLQPDIGKLYNLIWLDVKNCKKLRCVPVLPPRLRYFDAHGCDSLERVANSVAFPMSSEEISATFIFSNCYNLDQDAKDNIISYTRLKSQLVLDELTRYDGGSLFEVLIGTCFPGWEVPMWFIHQASGSVLKPKMSSHWCHNKFTGIAVCAVIEFSEYHGQRNTFIVECNSEFKNEDGSIIRYRFTLGGCSEPSNTPQEIESSHVFIGFTSRLHINNIGGKDDGEKCFCTETSIKFQVTDGIEEIKGCEVVKCGFTLVHAYDEGERICLDSNTFVIPERIENIPGEGRPYGNSRSHDGIKIESYSGLTLGRDKIFFGESKYDVTPNLQQSFDSKRFDLSNEESDAGGAIVVSSHDNTCSGSLVTHKTHSLVGVELRLKQMEKVLYSTPGKTRIVGVVGVPGIGKTTLATILFEKRGCKFPSHLFLTMPTACSLEQLRTVFLKELLKHENQDIDDNTTHESVKDKLLQVKVFIVLNGVSDKKQLEFLLGNLNWIKNGSKIVITTCDKSLLEGLAHDTYVVQQLNNLEAFQLFTYHAFYNQMCPSETFLSLSRMFVDHAAGNPLALEYLGSVLCGKDKTYWEQELQKVRQSLEMKMRDVWRFSIDQLNEQQKDVFLDILYFFKSEDEHFAKSLLDSENPDAMSEVSALADKFLIAISGGRVEMHDQLHTLGKDLGSPGRYVLKKYEEINKITGLKQQEANNVRGIFLDMSEITKSIALESMIFADMLNLRYLKIYDSCCPRRCKATCNLYLPDGLKFPLAEVRYLHWEKFPLQELPEDFRLKNLVDLRLPYSKIVRVWKGVKDTPRLKWVDLSHSSKLLDLSALSKSENLQRLNLEGCTSLDVLPVKIQNMKSLVFLNMRGCTSLNHLPELNLISLKTLILSDCSNLKEFKLISESVEFLHLDGTAIKELPPAIQNLQKLIMLNLKNCKMLERLPNCLGKMKALDELILSGCSRLKDLPFVQNSLKHLKSLLLEGTRVKEMPSTSCFTGSEGPASADMFLQSIGSQFTMRSWPCSVNGVSSLHRLCLSGNDFTSLQPDIGKLYNLIWLDVKNCKKLRCVPMLPPRLRYFDAHGCDSLERVANPLAIRWSEQIHATFNFSNCYSLDQDAKDSIISYTRLKSQLVLNDLTRYDRGLVLEVLIGTCFPGWEVPSWVIHQASGSMLKPKLPHCWFDNGFTGIGLCAVILLNGCQDIRKHVLVKCNGQFKNKNESVIRFSCTVGGWSQPSSTPRKIESSHVFIGFTSKLNIKKIDEEDGGEKGFSTETFIKFQVTDGTEEIKGSEVLKCGFSLLDAPEERRNICSDFKESCNLVIPDALGEKKSWFGSGSRIIVTTEDRSFLKAHDIDHIYKVKCPSSDAAFQIFCMHAFRQNHPPDDGFYELARKVSYLAGELPLGLEVLGSALRGKSKQEWEMILPRLMTSLDGDIESIIKFSYDALCDEDKYLFLYLSCFFFYEFAFKVEELLASRFPNVKLGLHILMEKSLIFDYDGRIKMHDLVRQFGRETARKKFVRNGITKRELLVDERDICEVLTEDTTDSNHLTGIDLNWKMTQENRNINISDKTLKKMADLQFISVYDDFMSPCESEMQSLFFHSRNIRSLQWYDFGNMCLPSTFNTEFLVNLHMEWSKLQKLWEGNKVLKNLKWMNLSDSDHLEELPDLSTATKLEELILRGCGSLVELPDLPTATKLRKLDLCGGYSLVKLPSSFGNFNNLEKIDLRYCRCLVELPFYIGTATNLQSLNLTKCSSLVKLPLSIGFLINLEEIILDRCSSLVEIPFSIGNLQKLKSLEMKGCSKLEALPTNINLESLSILDLTNCSQLKSFPQISTMIEKLYLTGTAINGIPLTIVLWPCLQRLHLKNCNHLVSLPQFPDSLRYLDASNCKSLERLDCSFNNPEIELVFSNCFKLNQEARDLIINTSCKLAELPGTEVPACFNYCRGTSGGIKLNESTHPTFLRFKVCFTLGKGDEETSDGELETDFFFGPELGIDIMVKQNDHIIPWRSSTEYINRVLRKHIYISEVAFEVEAEEVTSTEVVLEFKPRSRSMWKIVEWGLMQI